MTSKNKIKQWECKIFFYTDNKREAIRALNQIEKLKIFWIRNSLKEAKR